MPGASESQRRAAGRELGRRRAGKVIRQEKGTRPFGSATEPQLREFAAKPLAKMASKRKKDKRSVGHYMSGDDWKR